MTELELKIKIIETFLEDDPDWCFAYDHFVEKTGESRENVKKVMDSLRKIEMVEYVRGLMDDDGQVAGSGFQLTTRATQWSIREWLEELKKIK